MNEKNPTLRILAHFRYEHLPPPLQAVSRPLCDLAHRLGTELPPSAELTVGLRKLLEAKDCLVRAKLEQLQNEDT